MPVAPTPVDALTLLRHQHLEVEEIFLELERLQPIALGSSESSLDRRRQLTDLVIRKLMIHSGIEEEHFYPALRRYVADGDPLVEQAIEQHAHAEQTAGYMDKMSPDNLDFDGQLRDLIAGVRAHVRFEETELFPRIEAALSRDQLVELGESLHKAMKTAPTRPHPHTPPATSGVGKLLARGASVADRMRDIAGGRTRG